MKLLLTNDDGVDGPGLQALHLAAQGLGDAVIVAPTSHFSGCSHQVTTREPLRIETRGPARYGIAGWPADCVRAGLHALMPGADWVLSGINEGGNLGADVYISGTVAAVREAALHGRPGVAVSHYIKRDYPVDWERAALWSAPVLRDLLAQPCTPGTFWNINLPHLAPGAAMPDVVYCPLDPHPLPVSYRRDGDLLHYQGNYHQRVRIAGGDVEVCFSGRIAVTRLTL